jgi:hypothetical protein
VTAAVAAIASPRPLPPPTRLLLRAEIAWTTVRVRRLLRRNDLSAALDRCRNAAAPSEPAPSRDEVVRVARAVRRTLGALPGDSRVSLHRSSSSPCSRGAASLLHSLLGARAPASARTRGSRSGGCPRYPRRRTSSRSWLRCRTPAAERVGGLARSSRRGGSRWRGGSGAPRSAPPPRGSRRTTGPPR